MDLSDDERDLVLAGLFELTIKHFEDDETRERCRVLARKLGGDPEATLFGAREPDEGLDALTDLPGVDDKPDGIYYPHAVEGDESLAELTLARLLADCVTNGRHHLATLDHPEEGMILGCTHCHRYWRTTR